MKKRIIVLLGVIVIIGLVIGVKAFLDQGLDIDTFADNVINKLHSKNYDASGSYYKNRLSEQEHIEAFEKVANEYGQPDSFTINEEDSKEGKRTIIIGFLDGEKWLYNLHIILEKQPNRMLISQIALESEEILCPIRTYLDLEDIKVKGKAIMSSIKERRYDDLYSLSDEVIQENGVDELVRIIEANENRINAYISSFEIEKIGISEPNDDIVIEYKVNNYTANQFTFGVLLDSRDEYALTGIKFYSDEDELKDGVYGERSFYPSPVYIDALSIAKEFSEALEGENYELCNSMMSHFALNDIRTYLNQFEKMYKLDLETLRYIDERELTLIFDTTFVKSKLLVENRNGKEFILELMFKIGRDSITRFADMQVYTKAPTRGREYVQTGDLNNNLYQSRLLYYNWLTKDYDELWRTFSQSEQFNDRTTMYRYLSFTRMLLGSPEGQFSFIESTETMQHIQTILYSGTTLKGTEENTLIIETVVDPGASKFYRVMFRNLGKIY